MSVFLDRFKQIARDREWPDRMSPAGLLDQWDGFVRECEDGYSMGWDEYRNDIQCRRFIEVILTSPLLQELPELPQFEKGVRPIDERFRALLIPGIALLVNSRFWWELGLPNNVGEELRADLRGLFDINL
jgi:hypothetical protein